MKNTKISNAVIKRLPRYRRYLKDLQKKGVEKISSKEFSQLIGYTASQIRQDLNNFGDFGQQGYGYSVPVLYEEISSILGLDKEHKMVIVGAGSLGHALTKYFSTHSPKFTVEGVFEVNEDLIGQSIDNIVVKDYKDISKFVSDEGIDIGVVCVNQSNAQEVADTLCKAGVKGIWNFASLDIEVPSNVVLENVHLSDSLHFLAYHMTHMNENE